MNLSGEFSKRTWKTFIVLRITGPLFLVVKKKKQAAQFQF